MVGFPGLGIGDFTLKREIFSIGPFSVTWYGFIIALGFFLAVMFCLRKVPLMGLTQDDFIDMLIFAVPSAILGARLYYCIFNWSDFKNNLVGIIQFWNGGLAIYGAIIGAFIACTLFCWVRHIRIGAMLDLGAPGLLIGQAIGRWGNFMNIELYGYETTLPWRMRVNGAAEVHPLFLYESIWNALGLLILIPMLKKRRFSGQIFMFYVAWYGIGRGFLEGMRIDEFILHIGNVAVSQIFGFLTAIVAIVLIIFNYILKPRDEELTAYTSIPAKNEVESDDTAKQDEEEDIEEDTEEAEEEAEEAKPEEEDIYGDDN